MNVNPGTSSLMLVLNLPSLGKLYATCPSITVTLALPMRTLLLAVTNVDEPRAIALVIEPPDALADVPIQVMEVPAVTDVPAKFPKNALPAPVELLFPAPSPKNELLPPVVLRPPASFPKKAFRVPVVFTSPANAP